MMVNLFNLSADLFFMWLNDDGKWEELKKGYMERDSAAAIENASLIQRM